MVAPFKRAGFDLLACAKSVSNSIHSPQTTVSYRSRSRRQWPKLVEFMMISVYLQIALIRFALSFPSVLMCPLARSPPFDIRLLT